MLLVKVAFKTETQPATQGGIINAGYCTVGTMLLAKAAVATHSDRLLHPRLLSL